MLTKKDFKNILKKTQINDDLVLDDYNKQNKLKGILKEKSTKNNSIGLEDIESEEQMEEQEYSLPKFRIDHL